MMCNDEATSPIGFRTPGRSNLLHNNKSKWGIHWRSDQQACCFITLLSFQSPPHYVVSEQSFTFSTISMVCNLFHPPSVAYIRHSVNNSSETQDRSTTQLPSPTVHDWVVTAVFVLITPRRTSKDDRRKPQIEDICNFIVICRTKSIEVLNLHGFLCKFKWYFENWWKKLVLVLGPLFRDGKSLGTEQTQIKPNTNRGWPIKLVNHIQPQLNRLCQKSSRTPFSQNSDGAPPWVFNATVNRVSNGLDNDLSPISAKWR